MKVITVPISSNGLITVPAEIRDRLDLRPGDKIVFVIEDDGTVRLRKIENPT